MKKLVQSLVRHLEEKNKIKKILKVDILCYIMRLWMN